MHSSATATLRLQWSTALCPPSITFPSLLPQSGPSSLSLALSLSSIAAGFHTAQQTLHYSAAELQAATRLSPRMITAALAAIAARLAPRRTSAAALRREFSVLALGDPALDELLGGGLVSRGITELCGASGCGKTQLALQWTIQAQLPKSLGGLQGGMLGRVNFKPWLSVAFQFCSLFEYFFFSCNLH